MSHLQPETMARFAAVLHAHSGVLLPPDKYYLLETRLPDLLVEAGCARAETLLERLEQHNGSPPSPEAAHWGERLVDVMVNRETFFFRDTLCFETLAQTVLPELLANRVAEGQKHLSIWTAGCSTGQETYSVAMLLAEWFAAHPEQRHWDIRLRGSDIAPSAIARARAGVYRAHEIERGLGAARLERFFQRQGAQWQVIEPVRAHCRFQQENILTAERHLGEFDLIFCRNVALYFTPLTRAALFDRLARYLAEDGYLIVGAAESLADLGSRFRPVRRGKVAFYQPHRPPVAYSSADF